jgi:RNAse (barnase) inhibitor barstar
MEMETMSKKIILDGNRILDRESMAIYMKEVFDLPSHFGKNLDALNDVLSEVQEDTDIVLTRRNVDEICKGKYAYKVLMVLGRAADENPHLKIRFAENDEEENA